MSFLRERMGTILVVIIGVALFAFIASEVVTYGRSFMSGDATTVGEVAGQKIAFEDYNTRVKQSTEAFMQQSGQTSLTPQITEYVQENAWNQTMSQIILKREMDKLGVVVGDDEVKAIISGPNPDPQIVQYFGDPKTGQLDRNRLNAFLRELSTAKANDPRVEQWAGFLEPKIDTRRIEKYIALVHNGLYVNSLEAQDSYQAKNKLANFTYVELPYSSLADNKVSVTDNDYQEYYDEHKGLFKNPQETRSFDYVAFNAAASAEDQAAIKSQMDKLAGDFKASTNDSLFVQINAETKAPLAYQRKGQLEPQLDSVMFNAAPGFVYGPYLSNGSFKIAKLVDSRVGPDSVSARHILLNPATSGGVDKALAKADSIKKLIQGGRPFAEFAKNFSEDKASAEKGGDLGTFGRGAMVPAFEEAAFNGKPGDLKVVTSQFGVHLINVVSQKGSSKVVKVATVDKPVVASNKTQSAAYNKAQSFLSNVSGDDFAAQAKKAGLTVKPANDVIGTASALPGLDNARELVKWAFNKAEKGDVVDQVYTLGDQYVIAHLTKIKKAGTLSLEDVKDQIKADVLAKVKAKQLSEKLQSAVNGASGIQQVAQKAGAKAVPVENIVFANPVIPGLSLEYKVIGTVFGSKPNKVSKPIEGSHGVYVVSLNSFLNPAVLTNTVREKQQLSQTLLQQVDSRLFDALKDKANVKDYRYKFL
ncbi:SurA N-terminal domain-containing protein [Mucilaginibacter sp. PAMB04168]|uniref:SurA N-terminal domain-containing protein n=1 Tax=Mucilaginibacter sp. PAMB04168 TaxID=3138567 RepID=UPI0031F62C07